jgi:NADH-quinone oxidoreductase subunit K
MLAGRRNPSPANGEGFRETVSGDVFVFSDFLMYSRNDYYLSQNKKSKSFIPKKKYEIRVYGFFTRRNLVTMLMAVELILNSVNLNFIAFNKYLWPHRLDGLFFTIFIITIAAAEAAVAIAIIINLYRSHKSIDVEDATELKW